MPLPLRRLLLAACAAACAAACLDIAACSDLDSTGPGIACTVTKAATLAVELRAGAVLAPARLNETPVVMVLDTGAETTAVTGQMVSQLGLLADPFNGTLMTGVGGEGLAQSDALLDRLAFGPYDSGSTHVAVIELHMAAHTPPLGGLLGDDVLARFDLDLDLPSRRLTLYEVRHCAGRFLPWTADYAAVPLRRSWDDPRMRLQVAVEGQPMTALIDTGASSTVMGSDAAERLGVTAEALAHGEQHMAVGAAGVDAGEAEHVFRDIAIGPEHLADVTMGVLDRPLHDEDLLLGLDWIAARHVWISFRTHQLFIAASSFAAARPSGNVVAGGSW